MQNSRRDIWAHLSQPTYIQTGGLRTVRTLKLGAVGSTLLLLITLGSLANADPIVDAEFESLGNGLYSWTIRVDPNTGMSGEGRISLRADALFGDTISQIVVSDPAALEAIGGPDIDLLSQRVDALALDPQYAALASLDSYFDNSTFFATEVEPDGGQPGNRSFTWRGRTYDDDTSTSIDSGTLYPVARIVTDSPRLKFYVQSEQAGITGAAVGTFDAPVDFEVWDSDLAVGDWFDSSHWETAVPNAPGTIAIVDAGTFGSTEAQVTSPVVLGQLRLGGGQSVNVTGNETITFDSPGSNVAQIRAYGTRDHGLSTPIAIAPGQNLVVDVIDDITLTSTGGILSSDGNVTKTGIGEWYIDAASPSWDGVLTIEEGSVRVGDAAHLGTAVGETRVLAGGTLIVNTRTAGAVFTGEPIVLDGGAFVASESSGSLTISSPIELLSDSVIESSSRTVPIESVISGSGGFRTTSGQVNLSGANTYLGHTTLAGGDVSVLSPTALGSPTEGTTVLDYSALALLAPTAEPINVRGGSLFINSDYVQTGVITLESGLVSLDDGVFPTPLVLNSVGESPIVRGRVTTVTGGIVGVGDVVVEAGTTMTFDDQPIAHDGGIVFSGNGETYLNRSNTYTGTTVIVDGNVFVNHSEALGTSDTPIVVTNGTLTLNEVVDRDIRLQRDSLNHPGVLRITAADHFANEVILAGGDIQAGTFDGPIYLETPDGEGPAPYIRNGTFNGVIYGPGGFDINGTTGDSVVLNAENTYLGLTLIRGSGVTEMNVPNAFGTTDTGTIASNGELNVNVATDEPFILAGGGQINLAAQLPRLPALTVPDGPTGYRALGTLSINTPSQYDEHLDALGVLVDIQADTHLRNLTIRDGGLNVAPGASLTIDAPELEIQAGELSGAVNGAHTVRKTTSNTAQIDTTAAFDGDIIVDAGSVGFSTPSAFGSTSAPTIVNGEANAVLWLSPPNTLRADLVVPEEFELNNAMGPDHLGGLRGSDGNDYLILSGTVDLGSVGSAFRNKIKFTGPVEGRSLHTMGEASRVYLSGGEKTYHGITDVREGLLVVDESATLLNTSGIEIHRDATMILDNRTANLTDRVNDSAAVTMFGGTLELSQVSNGDVSEDFGELQLAEGFSQVVIDTANSQTSHVTFASIDRTRGAVGFADIDEGGSVQVMNPPELVGNIIPWMHVADRGASVEGFATIDGGTLVPFRDFVTDITVATANDNVRISGNSTVLTRDTTVNSLTIDHTGSLDLGGFLLTLESGALSGETLLNGQITVGPASGNELMIHGNEAIISASITDNASGPVDLTIGGRATLSGVNTYTGATTFNDARIDWDNEAAIPDGTDLHLSGAELRPQFGQPQTEPKHFGTVRVTEDAQLNGGYMSFDTLLLEHGSAGGRLSGSGEVIKTTDGVATLSASADSTYSGTVTVKEGRLDVHEIKGATYDVEGGTLYLGQGDSDIMLAGGELIPGDLSGDIQVLKSSRISVGSSLQSGTPKDKRLTGHISGNADLIFDARTVFTVGADTTDRTLEIRGDNSDYSGNIDLLTGTIFARGRRSLGVGDITVHAGGRLIVYADDDPQMQFDNDVVLEGGELVGQESNAGLHRFTGQVSASGLSRIGGGIFTGEVLLNDGARLTTVDQNDIYFNGPLLIGGITELRASRTEVSSSSVRNDQATITIAGPITSNAPNAVLDIVDFGVDDVVFLNLEESIQLSDDQSLEIRRNGQPIELDINGDGRYLAGSGLLNNAVVLEDGATIQPGQSPGVMTIANSATLGPGSVFEWEVNDAMGTAGNPIGWDLLDVKDQLMFTATPENPFELSVQGLNLADEPGMIENFDPEQEYHWLVASASSVSGFDTNAVAIDYAGFAASHDLPASAHFTLSASTDEVWLTYSVPEPETLCLMLVSCTMLFVRRRT